MDATLIVGQNCYFFGFPYAKFISKFENSNLPFVKRALVSGMIGDVIYLDGINNPGFSGGPLVVINAQTKSPRICGVISGYYPEYKNVTNNNKVKVDSLNYYFNSGIILSYGIHHLEKIFERK